MKNGGSKIEIWRISSQIDLEIQDGDSRWKFKMEIQNGDSKWRFKMEIQNGDSRWRFNFEIQFQQNCCYDI